ncbi:copper homeostasis protein CutC [Actinomadura atramentaria]|uniref:copper homeostasis protein CutC n=1 Tax=Actinomadura atramentaria TaxID=1990 RepID=UPI0003608C86|nr:copper homeostasis protein CutC [Actinomadura atramentaria]
MALLEVVALTPADARAAQAGGADRIEVAADLAADMAADGLTPDPDRVARIRDATALPMRVVLRANAGLRTGGPELDRLRRAAAALAAAGADGFCFGFLDERGAPDTAAALRLADAARPLPWTFHRAADHAADPAAAWTAVRALAAEPGGGLDAVRTAGSPRGVDAGLPVLARRAAEDPRAAGLIVAGGGLRRRHVAVLAAAGITAFHVGAAVRPDGAWDAPADPALVAEWRALVRAATGG